jgi:hypothetical protein
MHVEKPVSSLTAFIVRSTGGFNCRPIHFLLKCVTFTWGRKTNNAHTDKVTRLRLTTKSSLVCTMVNPGFPIAHRIEITFI